jgi:2-polyprenyl-3-methyl-5-hydroxy-6-metoxy-1,4-benzoquinol methylase
LTPKDLENIAIKNSFMADKTVGMKYSLFSNKWSESSDTSVNYISIFVKN